MTTDPAHPLIAYIAHGRPITEAEAAAMVDAIRRAAPDAPGMSDTVNGTIKPLEWTQPYPNEETAYAETILGSWTVWEMSDGSAYCRGPSDKSGRPVGNGLEAAKAAAQADYEQRIRSCIATPANATDTAGLNRLKIVARCSTDSVMRHFAHAHVEADPDGDYCYWSQAEATIAALRADLDQGARDYCDLMVRHDAHFVSWQSAKRRAEAAEARCDRLQAELARMRDRLTSTEFLRPLIQEQSAGEWDDKTIDADVETFAAAIRAALTDSQKETHHD